MHLHGPYRRAWTLAAVPWHAGHARNLCIFDGKQEADLVIGIGVRFSDRATGNAEKYASGAKVIHIDADFAEIGKNINVDCGISGDITSTVSASWNGAHLHLIRHGRQKSHPSKKKDAAS